MKDLDREFNIPMPGAGKARKPAKTASVQYDSNGQRVVIDPNYMGVSPDAPLVNFRDPKNAKRAGVPNTALARLDPDWSEHDT